MPTTPDVFQPRFRNIGAMRGLRLWQYNAATPSAPEESDISTSPEINWTGLEKRYLYVIENDFDLAAGGTLPVPWTATKTGTSTNNTVDYVNDAVGGNFALTHSADSEAQTMRVDTGDQLTIDINEPCFFEARLKVNITGATMSADQRWVAGFSSAYNATLDSATTNCWFRAEGANLNILWETDDGTTDDDDNDSTIDWVDNTYITLRIEKWSASQVHFIINGVLVATGAMAAISTSTAVQPLVCIQRDAGTEQEVVTIDYIRAGYLRA